ncbi:MAG: hypothetical protein HQL54_00115 [Magnetococcales bacterium]|nr:hypothetical protein [Magnetococcales bacterium]
MRAVNSPKGIKALAITGALALATVTSAPAPAQADAAGIATVLGGAALLGLMVHASQPLPVAYEPMPYPVVVPQQVEKKDPAIIYSSATPVYYSQPPAPIYDQGPGQRYYHQQPAQPAVPNYQRQPAQPAPHQVQQNGGYGYAPQSMTVPAANYSSYQSAVVSPYAIAQ